MDSVQLFDIFRKRAEVRRGKCITKLGIHLNTSDFPVKLQLCRKVNPVPEWAVAAIHESTEQQHENYTSLLSRADPGCFRDGMV